MSAHNINAFALARDERAVYGGTKSGQLLVLDPLTLEPLADIQAHAGSIETVAAHPSLPFIGMLGKDRHVSIFDVSDPRAPRLAHFINVRWLTPPDDPPIPLFPSTSQALTFHDTQMRFAAHSGNGGLLEMTFDGASPQVVHCSRVHGNYDFVTARYVHGSCRLLTSTVRGMAYLSEVGVILRQWDLGEHNNRQTLHWFEPLPDGSFLIASDGQQVIRLDVEGQQPAVFGPLVARDHLEHVTYQHATGRAFCASFDRWVHEVSPQDCSSRGAVWHAPFKLRWIKALESRPDLLLVNCRNGGLYQVSIAAKAATRVFKQTPPALWTAAVADGSVHVLGEPGASIVLKPDTSAGALRCTRFQVSQQPFQEPDGFYVKRAVSGSDGKSLYFGRTDGGVWMQRNGDARRLAMLPSAVRDLVVIPDGPCLLVATEGGVVHRVELPSGAVSEVYRSATPLWALAWNPARSLLAIGHRTDGVVLLDPASGTLQPAAVGTRFCKRMRWLDDETLLIGNGGDLLAYSLRLRTTRILASNLPNTIEDFDWSADRQYLVVCAYSRYLYLVDLSTGQVLDLHGHEMDYAKGVLFLPESVRSTSYRADFLAFGRDGAVRQFRVHDDRIISLDHIPMT